MLQGKEENRISAIDLCKELDDIVKNSKSQMEKSRKEMSTSIVEILLAVDEEAPVSHSSSSGKQTALNMLQASGNKSRISRKSEWRDELPVKTPYRTENLKHEMNSRRSNESNYVLDSSKHPLSITTPAINATKVGEQPSTTIQHHYRQFSEGTITSVLGPAPRRYKPDVFQAREEVENRDAVGFARFIGRVNKKDILLNEYFDNRDLVRNLSLLATMTTTALTSLRCSL
jgi:hypothetical protein